MNNPQPGEVWSKNGDRTKTIRFTWLNRLLKRWMVTYFVPCGCGETQHECTVTLTDWRKWAKGATKEEAK